jgi:hypothetical protein
MMDDYEGSPELDVDLELLSVYEKRLERAIRYSTCIQVEKGLRQYMRYKLLREKPQLTQGERQSTEAVAAPQGLSNGRAKAA